MTNRPAVFVAVLTPIMALAVLAGFAVGGRDTAEPTMTFAECQASAQYENGGQYAVEYDNGTCIVQRP